MKDSLLLILSIIGLFALYWVFFGQWKHNKGMREAEMKRIGKEIREKTKNKDKK